MPIKKLLLAGSIASMGLLAGCQSYNELASQVNQQLIHLGGDVDNGVVDPAQIFAAPQSREAALQHLAILVRQSPLFQRMALTGGGHWSDMIPKETPIAGVYVLANPYNGTNVIAVDQNLRFFRDTGGWRRLKAGLSEPPLDMKTQLAIQTVLFQQANFDDAIIYRFGHGSRKVLAITALDCPHSRDLFSKMLATQSNYNATLYVYPNLLNPNPANNQFVRKIWCSANAAQQYDAAMTNTAYVAKYSGTTGCDFEKRQADLAALNTIFAATASPFLSTSVATYMGFPERTQPDKQSKILNFFLNGNPNSQQVNAQQGNGTPRFEDYSVSVPTIKHPVLPVRKELRDAVATTQTNFAGHYIVVSLDCGGGTACMKPFIGDTLTGKSIGAPLAVGAGMDVKTQVNSRLFVLSTEGKVQYYDFNGEKLRLIKEVEQDE